MKRVGSRSSDSGGGMTSARPSRNAISRKTITPPSEDIRPASKVAVSGLPATDDKPGKSGVACGMGSGDSGGDAHASASTPESYANPTASSPLTEPHNTH